MSSIPSTRARDVNLSVPWNTGIEEIGIGSSFVLHIDSLCHPRQ